MARHRALTARTLPGLGRTGTRVVAALLLVGIAAGLYAFLPRTRTVKASGEFQRAVGLYPGSDVRILGVRVGTVLDVRPAGDRVKVDFEFDGDVRVPADAKAAVIAPSLVSDRYVQIFPAYTQGPTLAAGATIPLERTAVPVELDRISQSLDDLMVALGPQGANKNGALSRLLETSARNLDGQGVKMRDTTRDLSLALTTLAGGKDDLFSTVKNLQSFTSMLATNDAQVKRLNQDLANVAVQLEGERGDLSAALQNLAVALSEISSFVKDNRALIKSNIDQLTAVSATVAKNRDALAEAMDNAPVALSNLQNAYHPQTGTLDTRNNMAQLDDPRLLLCSLLGTAGAGPQACAAVIQALSALGPLPPTGSRSAIPPSLAAGQVQLRGADPTLGGLLPVEGR